MSDWHIVPIGSLGRVVTGRTPITRNADNFNGSFPFITIPDLDGRVYVDTTQRTLSASGFRAISSSALPAGAVLMSCIATVGRCGITVAPSVTNQQINAIIPNDEVDGRFLYYLFTSLGHELEAAGGGGSVYTNVSKSRFSAITIKIPRNISEQRAIASLLGAFDDKIQLNRQLTATLETITRSLFKSWFVDFDPVRAKAEGRDSGLLAEIAALFPDSFEKTNYGDRPSGWLTKSIADMAELSRATINPGNSPDEYFEHYSIPAYDAGRGAIVERGEVIKSNKFRVVTDAILLSRLNPRTPRIWMPTSIGPRRAICSTEFAVMRPKVYSREWLYCLFSNQTFCDNLTTMVTGTSGSHQRVRPESLLTMPTIAPTEQVVQVFTSVVSPFLTRVALAHNESLTLAALRDALLPKLISGEFRVTDAERILAASP